MKKVMVALLAGALATFGLTGTALALHDGGVARCEACHTMHNSLGNVGMMGLDKVSGTTGQAGPFLLKGNDQSSACLNCHGKGTTTSSYHVATEGIVAGGVPQQFTPGGDFSWIKAASTNGDNKGHSIIATDFGYSADTRAGMATAPGGSYPNAQFYCSSCHDPHGKYRVNGDGSVTTTGAPIGDKGSYGAAPTADMAVGAYRLLGGVGYKPKSIADGSLAFTNQIPAAVVPSSYNTATAKGGVRVAYGSGMAEWCANCHGGLLMDSFTSGMGGLRHPSGNGAKLGTIATNYNSYVKSGDLTGVQDTSFLPLVPFETGQGQADRTALTALVTATTGPDATANVMCLSCHRAHASGFDSMLRWNHKANVLATNGVYAASTGLVAAQMDAAYYNKPATEFATFQRSLCNKCHAKD